MPWHTATHIWNQVHPVWNVACKPQEDVSASPQESFRLLSNRLFEDTLCDRKPFRSPPHLPGRVLNTMGYSDPP